MNSAASASQMPPNPTFDHNAFNCSRSSYSLPAVRRLICCIASVIAKPSFNCLSCAGVALLKSSISNDSSGMRACNRSSFSLSDSSSENMIWRICSVMVMVQFCRFVSDPKVAPQVAEISQKSAAIWRAIFTACSKLSSF